MNKNLDFFAQVVSDEGSAKPQSLTDATFIVGSTIDTIPAGSPRYNSLEARFNVAYTAASGASGATVAANITVYHDTASGMGTEAALGTYTGTFTWAADGANSGVLVFPISLKNANRYVRVKAKITKAGTITVSSPIGGIDVSLAGLNVASDSAYVSTGYKKLTEAS